MELILLIIAIVVLAGWIAWLEFNNHADIVMMFSLDDDDHVLTSEYVNCITSLYSNKLISDTEARRFLGVKPCTK